MKTLSEFQKIFLYMLTWIVFLLFYHIAEKILEDRILVINIVGGAIIGMIFYLINRYRNNTQ